MYSTSSAKAYIAHARNICSIQSTTAATNPSTMAENWLKGFSASWIEPHSMTESTNASTHCTFAKIFNILTDLLKIASNMIHPQFFRRGCCFKSCFRKRCAYENGFFHAVFAVPVGEEAGQCVLPVAHVVAHSAAQHPVVQCAPLGAVGAVRVFCLVLLAGAGGYGSIYAGKADDLGSKIVPRADALAGAVVQGRTRGSRTAAGSRGQGRLRW